MMGREVKRLPLDFDWPLKETWFGYVLPAIPCQLCNGSGKRPHGKAMSRWGFESDCCDCCEGEGKVFPRVELPEWKHDPFNEEPVGMGYQMWETTSEGSPISPVFATPEELARWLADTKASAFGGMGATYAQWLGMIQKGSAPSAFITSRGIVSGVEGITTPTEDRPKA